MLTFTEWKLEVIVNEEVINRIDLRFIVNRG